MDSDSTEGSTDVEAATVNFQIAILRLTVTPIHILKSGILPSPAFRMSLIKGDCSWTMTVL